MNALRRLGIVLSAIVILALVLFAAPKPDYPNENPWLAASNDGRPLVMAHAGGKGVYPDNTMKAFQYAYDLGVDVLEMDLQMTLDRILVLHHGDNGTGKTTGQTNCDTTIWTETYQDLYDSCNFGYHYTDDAGLQPYKDLSHDAWVAQGVHLTTLESLFAAFGDTILYNIEIKADADAWRTDTADELFALVETYDLFDEVLVATAFQDISEHILANYPELQLSTSYDEAQRMILSGYTLTSSFYRPGGYAALQIPTSSGLPVIGDLNLATRLLIGTAHRHNMAVHYWTINDEAEMRRLIELGADGIITDYPELLMDILNETE